MQQRSACDSAARISIEPWATHYRQIVADCDKALADLPADESPVEEKHQSALASLFVASSGLAIMLGGALETEKKNASTALNSAVALEIQKKITAGELIAKEALNSAVQAEIKRLTDAGEFVPKATVTQLCSEANTNGMAAGETKVRNEITAEKAAATKVNERKAVLQTASFPIPDTDVEKLLGGTDEEFAARKTKAEQRIAGLKAKGFAINSAALLTNVWRTDAEYASFEKMIGEIPALKSTHEPFAGGPAAGGAPTRMI